MLPYSKLRSWYLRNRLEDASITYPFKTFFLKKNVIIRIVSLLQQRANLLAKIQ